MEDQWFRGVQPPLPTNQETCWSEQKHRLLDTQNHPAVGHKLQKVVEHSSIALILDIWHCTFIYLFLAQTKAKPGLGQSLHLCLFTNFQHKPLPAQDKTRLGVS